MTISRKLINNLYYSQMGCCRDFIVFLFSAICGIFSWLRLPCELHATEQSIGQWLSRVWLKATSTSGLPIGRGNLSNSHQKLPKNDVKCAFDNSTENELLTYLKKGKVWLWSQSFALEKDLDSTGFKSYSMPIFFFVICTQKWVIIQQQKTSFGKFLLVYAKKHFQIQGNCWSKTN